MAKHDHVRDVSDLWSFVLDLSTKAKGRSSAAPYNTHLGVYGLWGIVGIDALRTAWCSAGGARGTTFPAQNLRCTCVGGGHFQRMNRWSPPCSMITNRVHQRENATSRYGSCPTRTFVGTDPPTFWRIGSRSLPCPMYFTWPSRLTSSCEYVPSTTFVGTDPPIN